MNQSPWNANRLTMSGLAVLGLLAAASVVPYWMSWSKLSTAIRSTEEKIALSTQHSQDLLNVQKQARLIRAEVKDYDKLVPGNQDLGPFLGQLTERMQRAGMTDTAVRALAPVPRGKCDQLPIELRGAGTYADVTNFLVQLEGLERKSSVNHLIIDGGSTMNGRVTVEISLAIFNTRNP